MTSIRVGRGWCLPTAVIAGSLLLFVVLSCREWLYSDIGWLDPWVYLAYGFRLDDPTFGGFHYKSSRLPWLLVQYIPRSFLSPLAANFGIVIASLVATAGLFFATARKLVDDRSAYLCALFLAFWTSYHDNGQWDYHNTLCGPLFLACLYFCVRCSLNEDSDRRFLIWGQFGVWYALLLHTNFLYLTAAPVIAVLYFVIARLKPNSRLWKDALLGVASALVGFVLATMGLGLISVVLGRPFLFFEKQLRYTYQMVLNPNLNQWWQPLSVSWLKDATYLAFPCVMGIASLGFSLWFLASGRRRGEGDESRRQWLLFACMCQMSLFALIWVGWQLKGSSALQPDYMAFPLIIPAFLALAGWLSWSVGLREGRLSWRFLVLSAVLTIAPLGLASLWASGLQQLHLLSWPILLPMIMCTISLTVVWKVRRWPQTWVAATLLVSCINVQICDRVEDYSFLQKSDFKRDAYLSVIEGCEFIWEQEARFRGATIWFQESEAGPASPRPWNAQALTRLAYSASSMSLQSFLGPAYPLRPIGAISERDLWDAVRTGRAVVVFGLGDSDMKAVQRRYGQIGLPLAVVDSKHIARGPIEYDLYSLVVNVSARR